MKYSCNHKTQFSTSFASSCEKLENERIKKKKKKGRDDAKFRFLIKNIKLNLEWNPFQMQKSI